MPVNYPVAVQNARLNAVVSLIGTAGVMVVGDSTLSGATGVLASVPLANPAFTVSGGVMTLASVPRSVNASATGTAAKAEIRDSSGTVVITGLTVGLSGTDVIINATSVSTGQTLQVTLGTITHA